jgi:hypothetical protein
MELYDYAKAEAELVTVIVRDVLTASTVMRVLRPTPHGNIP